ncbi:hypothetical protein HK099_007024 [Clydaea vesicula]|uniref:Uncharacterized protein n=1 Tax=Clydaea vesicula TaxID=447962 RepID=A0AAD5U5M5_9FUNG|nr:hypothetical protein HK099_007024 [Clydaea vesicula]KAJ3391395.1 hypothetical protein HDU92_009055 [Lobulomyces angularis]
MSALLATFDQLLADVDDFLIEMKEKEDSQDAVLPTPPSRNYENVSRVPFGIPARKTSLIPNLSTDIDSQAVYTRQAFLNRASSFPTASSGNVIPLNTLSETNSQIHTFSEERIALNPVGEVEQSNQRLSSLKSSHNSSSLPDRKSSITDGTNNKFSSNAPVQSPANTDKSFKATLKETISANQIAETPKIKVFESKYVYLEEPKRELPKYDYGLSNVVEVKAEVKPALIDNNLDSTKKCDSGTYSSDVPEVDNSEHAPTNRFQKQTLSRISPEEKIALQLQQEKIQKLHQDEALQQNYEEPYDEEDEEEYSEEEPRVLNFRFNEQTEIFYTYHKSEYDRAGPKKKSYEVADAEELADEEEEAREEAAAGIAHIAHTHTFKGNIYGD